MRGLSGDDIRDAGLDVQAADDLAHAPLEDLDDHALRTTAEPRPLDPHRNAIAVHDFAELLAGR